jgi:hypothetical protein
MLQSRIAAVSASVRLSRYFAARMVWSSALRLENAFSNERTRTIRASAARLLRCVHPVALVVGGLGGLEGLPVERPLANAYDGQDLIAWDSGRG